MRNSAKRVAAIVVLLTATSPALAQGPTTGQILRPRDQSAATILESDRVLRFVLRLPVKRELAFDAWTDATQLVEWLSHWAEMTVAVGDGFRIGWEGYDGVWEGRYLEIDRPAKLVFTWLPPESIFPGGAYETIVTVLFQETEDGATLLTLEHSGFRASAEMEAQLLAWRPYLFALRAFLLQPPVNR